MTTFYKYFKRTLFIFFSIALFFEAYAQERVVSGRVVEAETEEPLPGVNVVVPGTTIGTTTDFDGNYSLTVPEDANNLVFSFIGFAPQEVQIGNRSTIDITLATDVRALSEVVVTGYSTQERRDVTGAIATVDPEDLLRVPAANVGQQLQGRVAGVTVGPEASPGGTQMIRIRGFGTIGDNAPLFIIDGVPTKGDLNTINQNDIESIQILKDASAASIYGSRAGNGVVIITTKRGRVGAPSFSFDAYYGMQIPGQTLDLMNSQQIAELEWLRQRNINPDQPPSSPQFGSGENPVIPDYIFPAGAMEGDPRVDPENYSMDIDNPQFGIDRWLITRANKEGTDWMSEIFNPAPIQNYQLSASGATEKASYSFSGNYFNQEGIIIHTGFKRYTARINSEFNLGDRFRIGENLQVGLSQRVTMPGGNQAEGNVLAMAYRMLPLVPVRDIMGFWAGTKGQNLGNANNPVAMAERNKDNQSQTTRIFGNVYAELDIIPNLTARTSFGLDYTLFNNSVFTFRNIEAAEPIASNQLFVDNNYNVNWTWTNILTYNRQFADLHRLTAYIGTEAIENTFRGFNASRANFFSNAPNYRFLSAGTGIPGVNGFGADWALFSQFARADYTFADRYMITGTIRRDGSSRFGPENRYGVFPAVSLGWMASEENFMAGINWVDDLKIRAGWGMTGNQEIANYNAFTTFRPSLQWSSYDLNGTNTSVVGGFDSQRFGNPNTRWETTTTINVGVDAQLFDRLDVIVDWYTRTTSDMLVQVPLAGGTGVADLPFVNIGDMRNVGWDFALTYGNPVRPGAFNYSITANLSTYRNEVLRIGQTDEDFLPGFNTRLGPLTRNIAGQPLSSFYGYIVDGIFQSEEQVREFNALDGDPENPYSPSIAPGRFIYRDINDDGGIDEQDQTFIGNPHPDFTYGLNVSLGFMNFDLQLFFQGVQGNEILNYVKYWTDFNVFQGNRHVRAMDTWTPDNPDASLPRWDNDMGEVDTRNSTYYIEDGSYFRARNIQLGYTFPVDLINRVGLQRARIYLQGQNLFTITGYQGIDPEITLTNFGPGGDVEIGVDRGAYPVAKGIQIGLNIGF